MIENTLAQPLFDLQNVFDVDDYMFAYQDELTPERTEREVALLVRLLELDTPRKILDLACGFGRHANRLAAMGHSVTGIDYMPGFLDIARRQAAEMGIQVDYRQEDMRRLDFEDEFDYVLLFFSAFGYFEDSENEQVLRNMLRALKPGGSFLFDMPNRDTFLKDLPPAEVTEKGSDLLINRLSFDALTGCLHNRRIVIRNGIRKDKPYAVRLYNATETRDMLERVGIVKYRLLGEDGQPVSARSRRIITIAHKPQVA